jgi:hypothetical protein
MSRALLLAALLLAAPPARAQVPAAPDSTLGGFLGRLSDSTDAYFGLSAAPPDTAGLDTVLTDTATQPRRRLAVGLRPAYDFNRVDGNTWGATLTLRDRDTRAGGGSGSDGADPAGFGRLEGALERAVGPRTTLGGARYRNRLRAAGQPLELDLWAGRRTARLDRDDDERALDLMRALVTGDDATQYLRADGFAGSLDHPHGAWRVRVAWRDLLQSPLVSTAGWNLLDRPLTSPGNLAAAPGRTREAGYAFSLRWPRVPLLTEVEYQTASRRLGSEFEYRRTRAAAALDLSLGRAAALVPQFAYGRLSGDAVPQAAFYLGGSRTMRSLHRDERAGTGLAIAKLELVSAGDALETLRLPHSDAFPLRAALFAATSAVWGRDPFSGVVVRGTDWPDRRDWHSEAGVSLLFRSALFSPEASLRYSCAWPIGPGDHGVRWSASVSRSLDLLRFAPKGD